MDKYSKFSSAFYILLMAQIKGDVIDDDDLNSALRKLHESMERKFNISFPVSMRVFEKYRENYFRPNYITEDMLREHIIPILDLIIQARKKLIWQELNKEDLYKWIHDTFSIVYKFRNEREEGWNSEKLLRDEVKSKHIESLKAYNE